MLAEEAFAAVMRDGLPPALCSCSIASSLSPALGWWPIAGSARRHTPEAVGWPRLKAAADKAGKPIYLEMSSVNPVVILPGALVERGAKVAEEFAGSCLMGGGQFCTNPGLVVLIAGDCDRAVHRRRPSRSLTAP